MSAKCCDDCWAHDYARCGREDCQCHQPDKEVVVLEVKNGRFRVWSYIRPSGHSRSSGFLRGTSAPVTEWAYALVDEGARPELVYMTSRAVPGFPSAEHAVAAAREADLRRSQKCTKTRRVQFYRLECKRCGYVWEQPKPFPVCCPAPKCRRQNWHVPLGELKRGPKPK